MSQYGPTQVAAESLISQINSRWDAKIEKFDMKTKFKKQANMLLNGSKLRSIDWYQKHTGTSKSRETIPLKNQYSKRQQFLNSIHSAVQQGKMIISIDTWAKGEVNTGSHRNVRSSPLLRDAAPSCALLRIYSPEEKKNYLFTSCRYINKCVTVKYW
jgi:hypothetical protein